MRIRGLKVAVALILVAAMLMGISVTALAEDGLVAEPGFIKIETNLCGYICSVTYSGFPAGSISDLIKVAADDFVITGANIKVYTVYVEGTSLKLNLVPFLPPEDGYYVDYTGSLPLNLDFSSNDVDEMVLGSVVRPSVSYEVMEPDDPLHLGPNIIRDPNSPTGYTVKFLYYSPNAESVQFNGDIALRNFKDPSDTTVYTPYEYRPGLMRSGAYSAQMEKITSGEWEGCWYIEVPLAAGANQYWFYENGSTTRWYPDPANPAIWGPSSNTLTKRAYNSIYVPYDPKQDFEPLAARAAAENPRTDGRTGTLTWEVIESEDMTRYIGVYLPYGYDPNREEPYKTIYMTPAYDQNESDFFGIGSCQNIMDNLLVNGLAEDAIIISTTAAQNNQFLGTADNGFYGLFNEVIPYVEAHYNVSTKAEDRAIGGHYTTAASLINFDATRFGYYLMLSYSGGSAIQDAKDVEVPRYFFSGGFFERTLNMGTLPDSNAEYIYYRPAGGHDFNCWTQAVTLYYKVLWKPDKFKNIAESSVTLDSTSIKRGETTHAAVSVRLKGTEEFIGIDDVNAINPDLPAKIEYFSLNPSIASVDENGVVTGNRPGITEIQAMVTHNEIVRLSEPVEITVEPAEMDPVPVSIVLPRDIVEVGEQFTATIKAEEAADLYAAKFKVSYDPDLFDVVDVKADSGLGDDVALIYNDEGGQLNIILTLLGDDKAINGEAALVNIIFKAKDIDAATEFVVLEDSSFGNSYGDFTDLGEAVSRSIAIADSDVTGGGLAINDLVLVAKAFGCAEGDEGYDPSLDMNKDGVIDIIDIAYVAARVLGK